MERWHCRACDQDVPSEVARCPFCGAERPGAHAGKSSERVPAEVVPAEVEPATNPGEASPIGGHPRALRVAGVAVLAIWCVLLAALLFACVAGAPPATEAAEDGADGASVLDDADSEEARGATGAVDMPADTAIARGGGDVVGDGGVLYWTDGAGIMRLALDDAGAQATGEPAWEDAELACVYEGPASCLNISGGDLYAVTGSAQGSARIVRLVGAGDSPAIQELYAAPGTITSMLVRDGWIYASCLEPDEDPRVLAIDLTRPDDPPVEHAYPGATALSLFWEGDRLLVHSTDGASWRLDEYADATAQRADSTPATPLSGSGAAQHPSCNGSSLYQAEQGADGTVRFVRRGFSGEFQEYAELMGAGLTACDASGCVVVTNAGVIAWVAEATGFSHDLAPAIEPALGDLGPTTVRIAMEDGILYLVADKGLYAVDVAASSPSLETLCEAAR